MSVKKLLINSVFSATLVSAVFLAPSLASAQASCTSGDLQTQIACLQQQILQFQALLTQLQQQANNTSFHDGSRVRTFVNLRIRNNPSVSSSTVLGMAPAQSLGTITCASTSTCRATADNYTWWRIHWDSASIPTGYSVQGTSEADYLELLTSTTTATHLGCSGNACVVFSGPPPNTDGCTSVGQACATGDPTHTICQNNACVRVLGSGTNQCSTNAECANATTTGAVTITSATPLDYQAYNQFKIEGTGFTKTGNLIKVDDAYSWGDESVVTGSQPPYIIAHIGQPLCKNPWAGLVLLTNGSHHIAVKNANGVSNAVTVTFNSGQDLDTMIAQTERYIRDYQAALDGWRATPLLSQEVKDRLLSSAVATNVELARERLKDLKALAADPTNQALLKKVWPNHPCATQ